MKTDEVLKLLSTKWKTDSKNPHRVHVTEDDEPCHFSVLVDSRRLLITCDLSNKSPQEAFDHIVKQVELCLSPM